MTVDPANELAELDQVVQWLLPTVDDLNTPAAAAALLAAKQAAGHLRTLTDRLEEHIADVAEPGTSRFGDLQLTVTSSPRRSKWDNEAIAGELRRRVVFDPGSGEERLGSQVWDRLVRLLPIKGYVLAGSRSGSERLADMLDLDSPNDLDQFCELSWTKKVDVQDIPEGASL